MKNFPTFLWRRIAGYILMVAARQRGKRWGRSGCRTRRTNSFLIENSAFWILKKTHNKSFADIGEWRGWRQVVTERETQRNDCPKKRGDIFLAFLIQIFQLYSHFGFASPRSIRTTSHLRVFHNFFASRAQTSPSLLIIPRDRLMITIRW